MRDLAFGERRSSKRFPIHTALRYRTIGEGEWLEGTTENISEGGVLFQTDHLLLSQSKVELMFNLTSGAGGQQAIGRGMIVRVMRGEGENAVKALAAKVSTYRFVRSGRKGKTA